MRKKLPFLSILLPLSLLSCNPPKMELSELNVLINHEFAHVEGDFALGFKLIGTNDSILINEKESFHAASTMKTPVMIELFKQAEAGTLTLKDSILVKNSFYSIVDSSVYQMDFGEDSEEKLYKNIGQNLPLSELIYDMIVYSSNLATNILIELADAKKVTQTMRDLGADKIQVLRGVEDIKAYEQGLSNTTSAYDLYKVYEALAEGSIVSPVACETMLTILKDQHFNDIIPAQLPEEVEVAHKTGWITGVRHDSGVVFLPDGRKYVLVILSKNLQDDAAAKEMMAGVSRMIYDYVVQ